jgi:hypothetical protein
MWVGVIENKNEVTPRKCRVAKKNGEIQKIIRCEPVGNHTCIFFDVVRTLFMTLCFALTITEINGSTQMFCYFFEGYLLLFVCIFLNDTLR